MQQKDASTWFLPQRQRDTADPTLGWWSGLPGQKTLWESLGAALCEAVGGKAQVSHHPSWVGNCCGPALCVFQRKLVLVPEPTVAR